MHPVSIKPQWTISGPGGAHLAERTVALLVGVAEHGSLLKACQAMQVSYRHAWQLIREGEALLGAPLLHMERGKGSALSPLAEKLVWADRRISARLSPMLDSLASELQAEIDRVLMTVAPLLRMHASHGFAVEALHDALGRAGIETELRYCGSTEAVASLDMGGCEVAGFHVPVGEFEAESVAHYAQWLKPATQKLIGVATRRLGLMVAKGDPKKVYGIRDLARPDIRFINRQSGSGTRFLLDLLLRKDGVDPAKVHGYEQCELTHAAVAAYVASGMADVGFGVETPARHFKLDFVPVQTERYFLLCEDKALESPGVREMLAIIRGDDFKATVNRLAGYQANDQTGMVTDLPATFPTLPKLRGRARRA
ncbi:substrate-binding domain-containing protein [Variovorax sp. J22R24]|uniref:helix-turn-helix transcriptional regulator n=1 Tax=Variovorax gracilis TaxID=3053502 RepID=UPI0025787FBA|nr:substrate-binding domain-containing protein [Variovorax sp. J22R24]MDM0109805.1 substrate-binding domain-containing protein [Variovorax sp. J22R24]